jgi:tetratricopeptide (TPR) repeat protein
VTDSGTRIAGLVATLAYAMAIGWVYVTQPQTVAQVTGAVSGAIGAYQIDRQAFDEGLRFFRAGQYPEARANFGRADAAGRDATTQFYIAYSYYREGWGRIYNDDTLFAQGLAAVDKAIALAPGGRLVVADADLQMQSADELRAELQRGLTRDASDFNPLRVLGNRK